MAPSPKSPQQRAYEQHNSEALAEYYKLAAKGHFTPAITTPCPLDERPHTPLGQVSRFPGSLLPAANSQEHTPVIFAAASSLPYVYKPRDPPPPTYALPQRLHAPVSDIFSPYVPPDHPPFVVAQSMSGGFQPTSVATSSPYDTDPHIQRPTLPSIAQIFTGTQMPTTSPYATAPLSACAAPAYPQNPLHTHATYSQQPNYSVTNSHNSNVSQVQQPNNEASTTHMPWFESTTPPMALLQQHQFDLQDPPQPPSSPSITYDGLCTRIQDVLHDTLPPFPRWEPANIMRLASSLANQVISAGKSGHLGPEGLWSYQDIFVVMGYEGNMPHDTRYLALVVMAPGQLEILLKTGSYNFGGRQSARDERLLAYMRQGFHNVALDYLGRLKGGG